MDDIKIRAAGEEIQDRIDEIARQVVDEGISALRLADKITDTVTDLRVKHPGIPIDVPDAVYVAILKIRARRRAAGIDARRTRAAVDARADEVRGCLVPPARAYTAAAMPGDAPERPASPFRVGDVVQLRGGGEPLTVLLAGCCGDTVEVTPGTFSGDELVVADIPIAALRFAILDDEVPF